MHLMRSYDLVYDVNVIELKATLPTGPLRPFDLVFGAY